MKILKLILKIIKYIFVIFTSFFVLITVYQRVMPNNSICGFRTYVIVSNSMSPKYVIGDIIISKVTEPKDIQVKDVIVYQGTTGDFQGKIITHQVEEIYKDINTYSYTTRGIAGKVVDPDKVTEEQIYGKVVYKLKVFSFISRLVRKKYGALICILVPLFIIFGLEFKELKDKLLNKDAL